MSPLKVLINFNLLCWSTILIGLRRGLISQKDVIDCAVDLIVNGNDDVEVAIIAGGESLGDEELFNLISNLVKQPDKSVDLDKWRLAHLLYIAESDDDEQTKLNRLQEVYANFDYPEDMASCSIYSQSEIAPLVAMIQVIEKLRIRLTQQ
ncbi:DUF2247 family protein [Kiloniella laminariae]|uniref:DUF2247 family protein n=1 Tax=Kiloniella laminariae TaxID=454162 RepID=A0ABT4LLV4_9PROT|nr:DUF2247 family protein [Kiloniella laminariae]MCZ4282100.1 DUF2247 family protein [Kiloniella laminariae]